MTSPEAAAEVGNHLSEIEAEVQALRAENARLRDLLRLDERASRPRAAGPAQPTLVAANDEPTPEPNHVTQRSSAGEKIALFRSLSSDRSSSGVTTSMRVPGVAREPESPDGAQRFEGVGSTPELPTVSTCRTTMKSWNVISPARFTQGSIRCSWGTRVVYWCVISMAPAGRSTPSPTSMPPTAWAFPPCWNDHDRGTEDTSGSFSAGTSERRQPGDSACTWSGRR